MHSAARTTVVSRQPVAREDRAFPWYIGGALAVAVLGGFALAIALSLAAALGWEWGVRWRALAQAHGHLQVVGWLGLFIAGMAFRLAPRFAGRPLRFASVTPVALALLATGLLARALAQPALDLPGMRPLLLAGATAELAGALLVALALGATLLPVVTTLPAAPLLLLSAAGFVVQALLALWWLTGLQSDYPALAADRDAALLAVQFYGFVLPAVLGVSLRSLPVFFRQPPVPAWRAWLVVAGLALGVAVHAVAPVLATVSPTEVRAQGAGALLIVLATALAVAHTGVWRAPERLRPSARAAALLIQTAYVWLTAAMVWLALDAILALRSGRPLPPAHADAIRHMLALGTFTTLIVGMGQLVLPWLAMRRQRPTTTRAETWTLWLLLTAATVFRVAGALLETRGIGAARYWPMAVGGVLALTAVALFALTLLRDARPRPPEIPMQVNEP